MNRIYICLLSTLILIPACATLRPQPNTPSVVRVTRVHKAPEENTIVSIVNAIAKPISTIAESIATTVTPLSSGVGSAISSIGRGIGSVFPIGASADTTMTVTSVQGLSNITIDPSVSTITSSDGTVYQSNTGKLATNPTDDRSNN